VPTSSASQPTQRNFSVTAASALGAPPWNFWPIAYSTIISGMPAVTSAMKYGMKNAPPPCLKATYGKRQILPRPTALPIAAIMKAGRLCQRSLWFCCIVFPSKPRQAAPQLKCAAFYLSSWTLIKKNRAVPANCVCQFDRRKGQLAILAA